MHSKTTTSKIVEALRTVFARNGLQEQLVSDNGPPFTAGSECQKLLEIIGQAVSVRNYRGKEKWIQGIVRARTGPLS